MTVRYFITTTLLGAALIAAGVGVWFAYGPIKEWHGWPPVIGVLAVITVGVVGVATCFGVGLWFRGWIWGDLPAGIGGEREEEGSG